MSTARFYVIVEEVEHLAPQVGEVILLSFLGFGECLALIRSPH
jgi:hypothetical protein